MAGFYNNPSPLSPSLSDYSSDVLHSVRKGGWEEFISTETLTWENEQSLGEWAELSFDKVYIDSNFSWLAS